MAGIQNASRSNPKSPQYVGPLASHLNHMETALHAARSAIPKATNFCVGALLVDDTTDEILSTGYTNELPGNTHAEQCALMKLEQKGHLAKDQQVVLYTTMEPCNKRASGNAPCTETIIAAKQKAQAVSIKTVYVGVQEPDKFVGTNEGRKRLEEAGIGYVYVQGLEEEILKVATAGHNGEE